MAKRKTSFLRKVFISLFIFFVILGIASSYLAYLVLYKPNVDLDNNKSDYIYIATGSTYHDVLDTLYSNKIIVNTRTFEWVADKKNYQNHVNSGRYLITADMGNNELINLLRSGHQKPVNLTFTSIRTKEQLAGSISKQLEVDSLSIISNLNDPELTSLYGFSQENIKLMFIPNTYEFYWTTSSENIFNRMHREYDRFWNDERRKKAEDINMTTKEVGVLASIVQLETNKYEEMSKIAGVYINRLKRNIALQADPTVIFAIGDYSIKRVLNRHLDIDSPYNTYKYRGLPPGPIALPEPYTIDEVLDYEKHDYLYFSAKEDFSGYHNFARTYYEHVSNANRYRQALN